MKRVLFLVMGFMLGAGLATLLVPKSYYDYGHWIGEVEVAIRFQGRLAENIDPNEPKEVFLGGKSESVLVVTRNGSVAFAYHLFVTTI
jgi:hypothetical protein